MSTSHLETNFVRYEAQRILFAARPSRLALQSLQIQVEPRRSLKVNVWRNHAIESILSLCKPFLAFGGIAAVFRLSDYDDTLMFSGWQPADVELLWLDSDRFLESTRIEDWHGWLNERLQKLRIMSTSPIIAATWLPDSVSATRFQQACDNIPATFFADLKAIAADGGCPLLDMRSAAIAGTPIRNSLQPLIARRIACHWIPAATLPPIKAVAVDLDNTLSSGVLGEDGVDGVQVTEGHKSLQMFLKEMKARGVFLALVSRNESPDVEKLFKSRSDFRLQLEDFSAREISWDDKDVAILRIAEKLRIAPDAILFVDDNPGELASVTAQVPTVQTAHADFDPSLTQRAIEYFPGLWRWKTEPTDAMRIDDLKATEERELLLQQSATPEEYFAELKVSIKFRVNPIDQLSRLADLCKKTNQFNMAMRRLSESEVAARLNDEHTCVVSVQLSDRLSDSGVIAVIVARREQDRLLIEELCISCRALGRKLEDTIVLGAIALMPPFAGCQQVAFVVAQGPRNQPAISWLSGLLKAGESLPPGTHFVSAERVAQFEPVPGVLVSCG